MEVLLVVFFREQVRFTSCEYDTKGVCVPNLIGVLRCDSFIFQLHILKSAGGSLKTGAALKKLLSTQAKLHFEHIGKTLFLNALFFNK